MNFSNQLIVGREKNGQQEVDFSSNENQLNLNMYSDPDLDNGVITLEEFHTLGLKRLKVLRTLETIKEKYGGSGNSNEEYKETFIKSIGELMPIAVGRCLSKLLELARKEDRISHFILRLAFCQSQDQSDWFIRQETELFRMRFQIETEKNILAFLEANGLELKEVDPSEKHELLDDLSASLVHSTDYIKKTGLYMVEFTEILDLLGCYRCYLRNGFAYISTNELVALIAPRFRETISASLANARRQMGFLQEDDRLIPLMRQMVQGNVAYRKDFEDPDAEFITPDMIDSLARSSFPLCMRNIHFNLRREHHLRYFARRQYGLFLKGVGLSVEGAIDFFRAEFTKRMDGEKFAKEYAYNIRHQYGKEGSRIEQKPLGCPTIILGNSPTSQDCHGCPFKHLESARLARQLEAVGLRSGQVSSILGFSKMHRPDKACSRFFEYTHDVPDLEELITHPNQYYSLSRKTQRGDIGTKKEDDSTENKEILMEH